MLEKGVYKPVGAKGSNYSQRYLRQTQFPSFLEQGTFMQVDLPRLRVSVPSWFYLIGAFPRRGLCVAESSIQGVPLQPYVVSAPWISDLTLGSSL